MQSDKLRQLLCFALVGTVGFIVDGGILTYGVNVAGYNLYLSRGVSFSAASLTTWYLNRVFVFGDRSARPRNKGAEYGRYIVVQVLGAITNLAVFSAVVAARPGLAATPVIPLLIGAVFGLAVNFTGSKLWVFRGPQQENK